ncbi:hypothetical protein MRB53_038723 [Persea americana]|nr:hypothetical protein MRB53_038723 [Persea americana]
MRVLLIDYRSSRSTVPTSIQLQCLASSHDQTHREHRRVSIATALEVHVQYECMLVAETCDRHSVRHNRATHNMSTSSPIAFPSSPRLASPRLASPRLASPNVCRLTSNDPAPKPAHTQHLPPIPRVDAHPRPPLLPSPASHDSARMPLDPLRPTLDLRRIQLRVRELGPRTPQRIDARLRP